jgi:hypothetical protein
MRYALRYALLALVLLLIGLAAAPAGVDAAPRSARGAGTIAPVQGEIAFKFEVERANREVTGRMRVEHPTLGLLRGTVRCVHFVSETAVTFSGKLREPVNGETHFQIVAQDNGRAGVPRPDVFRLSIIDGPPVCEEAFGLNNPVVSGEIKVR